MEQLSAVATTGEKMVEEVVEELFSEDTIFHVEEKNMYKV